MMNLSVIYLSFLGRYQLPSTQYDRFVVAVIALVFGIIWLTVNLYHLYPYVQAFVVPLLFRTTPIDDLYVESRDISDVPTEELPTIDVLLPAYREGNVIHQSISSIRRTNYPQELVNINVLLEPDDDETRAAIADLEDAFEFREITIVPDYEEIVVPRKHPGLPNKPRALNYGFELTDGDIVGIIDAEDIVDPDLFVQVYSGLVEDDLDYVQGILDMVNEGDGWLNTVFRGEYAWWFRWLLPAFHDSGYPVPLGGTTNFFHRSVLEEISARRIEQYGDPWNAEQRTWFAENGLDGLIPWDPRNVTEDFELGLFLWKEGYDFGLLEATTSEESPLSLEQWIRQRTRWQKGKVYSFIQYAHHRPTGIAANFHVFMQSILPHLAPVNIAGIVIVAMAANTLGLGMPIGVAVVLVLGLVFLVEINVFHAFSYWRVSESSLPTRFSRAVVILLTLPVYWVPLWGAELRAMKQVYTKQLDWEKTSHHGRNGRLGDAEPDPPAVAADDPHANYSLNEVCTGLLVLLFGLLLTVGLPLILFWLY